ncbi:MAG: hypothetical protein KAW19_07415, partial [Candidatus Aminicenantes bacterium]|nr:hypothetical protein [Candidatus Aminicenantes bacterium]
ATRIIGFNAMDVFTTQNAHERGLGIGEIKKIETAGENIRDVEVRNFKHSAIALGFIRKKIPAFLYGYFQDQLILIPEILRKKCSGCLECTNICPKGAAKPDNGKVRIDKNICIHCMCCHEVCRFHAIKLKRRTLGKIINGAYSFYKKVTSFF